MTFFTARRNALIASAVLATAIPSICPSVRQCVTRRYCVKTTARSTVQFALDPVVDRVERTDRLELFCRSTRSTSSTSRRFYDSTRLG